jgi:PAS domain S-box-containing protein
LSEASGDQFRQMLVRYLVQFLKAQYAFIGEIPQDSNDSIHTLSVYGEGHYHPNFDFPVAGSVCEDMFDKGFCSISGARLKEYHEPEILHHWDARTLAGIPLYRSDQQPIGVLVVAFNQIITTTHVIESTLKIYAARLAAELERLEVTKHLGETEQRIQLLGEEQPEMMLRWLPDGTRTYVNENYSRHFGESQEKLIGGNIMSTVLPEDRETIDKALSSLTPDNPVSIEEYRTRTRDGKWRWTRWCDKAFFNKKGHIKFLQSVGHDISDEKQEAPDSFSPHMNLALTTSNIGVWEWVPGDNRVYASGIVETNLNIKASTARTAYKNFLKHVNPEDRPLLRETFKVLRSQPKKISVDFRCHCGEGMLEWFNMRAEPIFDKSGKMCCVLGTIINVTERRVVEDALKESEENLRLIVSHSPDVIMRIDYSGKICFINYTLPEYSKGEAIGKKVYEFLSPADSEIYRKGIQRLKKTQMPQFFHLAAGGNTSWFVRLIPVGNEEAQGPILVIATNITEQAQMEQALKQSQDQYSLAERVANIGGWELDLNTGAMAWSATLEPMFGLKYGEFAGSFTDYLDLIHPQDREQVEVIFQRAAKNRTVIQLEHRVKWANDEVRWLLVNAEVNENSKGQASKLIGIMQDVTKFKMAQKALIASEQKWRTVVKSAPDIIAILTPQAHIKFVNHVLPELDIKDVVGASLLEFTPEEDHEEVRQALVSVFKERQIASYKTHYVNPKGQVTYFRISLSPLLNQGEVEAAIMIATDITEDLEIKSQLRESQERFQLLVEQSFDGYWDWPDINKDNMWWSPQFYKLVHVAQGKIQPRIDSLYRIMHPEDIKAVSHALNEHLTQNRIFDVQVRLLIGNNDYQWFQIRGRSLKSDSGKIRMSGSLQNIHNMLHKREVLEQLVSERTRALEAANRELESFSYSVSHDLRAPLRSIDGFSKLLMEDYEGMFDATALDYITRVRNSAQRMGELIDDLLKLSRVTSSKFEKEQVNLSRIMQIIHSRIKRDDGHRNVKVIVQEGLSALGDKKLLTIALENLFSNAWKYTMRRPIAVIEFGATKHGEQTVFYLRDNGAGFDMRYADRLFGAFQRLHSEKDYPGTGIGLATVHRIIKRHGGEIWVDSIQGEGTEFFFTLEKENGMD